MNWKMLSNRSFIVAFVVAFIVCFFGVTVGWDTIIADLIVLGVAVALGRAIGFVIRNRLGRKDP